MRKAEVALRPDAEHITQNEFVSPPQVGHAANCICSNMSAFSRLTSQLPLDMHARLEISLLSVTTRRSAPCEAARRVTRAVVYGLKRCCHPLCLHAKADCTERWQKRVLQQQKLQDASVVPSATLLGRIV